MSEKEKIFNTKAMVTCKRSAAVKKKLTSNRSCYSTIALCTSWLPRKTHSIHGPKCFTSNDKK